MDPRTESTVGGQREVEHVSGYIEECPLFAGKKHGNGSKKKKEEEMFPKR